MNEWDNDGTRHNAGVSHGSRGWECHRLTSLHRPGNRCRQVIPYPACQIQQSATNDPNSSAWIRCNQGQGWQKIDMARKSGTVRSTGIASQIVQAIQRIDEPQMQTHDAHTRHVMYPVKYIPLCQHAGNASSRIASSSSCFRRFLFPLVRGAPMTQQGCAMLLFSCRQTRNHPREGREVDLAVGSDEPANFADDTRTLNQPPLHRKLSTPGSVKSASYTTC